MSQKIYIGIDNGVTATIGFVGLDTTLYPYSYNTLEVPIKKEQNYTKKKGNISRIIGEELQDIINKHLNSEKNVLALLERPLVNPTRFAATLSAVRALEATLIVLELMKIPYIYLDSKQWQKQLLPQGVEGSEELKKASMQIACRLYPNCAKLITKHKDGDGILMATYGQRNNL